jgi:hypothetical protein
LLITCPDRGGGGVSLNTENGGISIAFWGVLVEGAYTQQGRTHNRRLRPVGPARPPLMGQAAHSTEAKKPWSASKSPSAHDLAWAALWSSSCASRLSVAASHPGSAQWRRWRSTSACAFWAVITTCCRSSWSCTFLAITRLGMRYRLAASSAPSAASCGQELLKSGPEFPVLAEGQRLHPAQLVELPLPRPQLLPLGDLN